LNPEQCPPSAFIFKIRHFFFFKKPGGGTAPYANELAERWKNNVDANLRSCLPANRAFILSFPASGLSFPASGLSFPASGLSFPASGLSSPAFIQ